MLLWPNLFVMECAAHIAYVCMDACANSTFSSPIEMYGTQTVDEVFKQGLFFLLSLAYYGSIHAMKENQELVQLTSSEK